MKKIMSKKLFVAIIVTVLVMPGWASAGRTGPHGDRSPCEYYEDSFVSRVLGLTEEQKDALRELCLETSSDIGALQEGIDALALHETLLAEEIETTAASEKIEEMLGIQNDINLIEAAAALDKALILTAEQRQLILKHINNISDFLGYIADYPGWDKIIDDYNNDIKPFLSRNDDPYGLDLTDEQKLNFMELKEKTDNETTALEEEIRNLGLKDALLAEEIDTETVSSKLDQMATLKTQVAAQNAYAKLEGAQILTPEQRQTLLKKIQWRLMYRKYR